MKASIEVPDELYRRVKAKSALEGRAIREVTAELFEGYVEGRAPAAAPGRHGSETATEIPEDGTPDWLGLARKHLEAGASHAWSEIEASIERGWATEVAEPAARRAARRRR